MKDTRRLERKLDMILEALSEITVFIELKDSEDESGDTTPDDIMGDFKIPDFSTDNQFHISKMVGRTFRYN